MAINSGYIKDREHNKFVESPTRAGQPAVETVIGGLLINNDGSINANVISGGGGGLGNLSHTSDSVRLGDGTNLTQVTAAGELKVTTSGFVTSTPSGLKNGGRVTEMTIDDTAWYPIPASPLANRNAISVQNRSGHEIKFNYVNSVGYIGMVVPDGYERHYDITDAVIIYARAIAGSGTITITVEEIS